MTYLQVVTPKIGDATGTVEFSSEITISLNFIAEHTENAKASENSAMIETVLKLCVLCALRGDKSLDF